MSETNQTMEKLTKIVGQDRVSTDKEKLKPFGEAPLASGAKPQALVCPTSTGEVKDLIKLARQEGMNLVLSSSAGSRFRGDSVPRGEAIIIDMSEMDRVVRMDRRSKVALIEPGVTFLNLIEEAERVGLKVDMPLLPSMGKSVISSYLEREPIQIPKYHWDMTDPMLCTELVFGTGEMFRTGSAAGPGSLEEQWAVGSAQCNPLGPGQCDLMRIVQGSQGTMGVVTWASVKLEVKPTTHRIYFVTNNKLSRIVDFSYRVLRRKLCDEFLILNARSLATVIASAPGSSDSLAEQQAHYTLIYGISGYEYLPEERIDYLEKDLAEIAQATGVEALPEIPGCSANKMEAILAAPSDDPYYKLRPKGTFLDIFFLTTLDKAQSFIDVMEREAEKKNYPKEEVGLYLQPIQHGRAIHMEFTLYYDPEDKEEAARAKKLFKDASRALSDEGAFFSRPYGSWADLAYERCPDTVQVLRKVKDMLDPDGVLNQGKLCFKEVA
jgi:FAD/FMN-containing dehydrogenase